MRRFIPVILGLVLGLLAGGVIAHVLIASGDLGGRAGENGWSVSFSIGEYGGRPLLKARVARHGLGALIAEEALYYTANVDGAGEVLSGANRYRLRFVPGALPPARAFWSLSVYDAETDSFVANPIERYSIGDRTSGVMLDGDGGLTLHLQKSEPASGTSNWLPVPDGPFVLVLRAYEPGPVMLAKSWMPPPVEKVAP